MMNAASGDRGSILNLWKISPLRFAPVGMTGRDRVEMKRRMGARPGCYRMLIFDRPKEYKNHRKIPFQALTDMVKSKRWV